MRNTVDMRALTKIPPSCTSAAYEEALQENMTLAVESARAIGCAVNDATEYNMLQKDAETVRRLLIDLIRVSREESGCAVLIISPPQARLVHVPGMEDEPSSTFTELPLMLKRLGLSAEEEETDAGGRGEEEVSHQPVSWREADNEALRKEVEAQEPAPESTSSSWRESPTSAQQQPEVSVDLNKPSLDTNLSYEERAALRRAERERRRREREAVATAK